MKFREKQTIIWRINVVNHLSGDKFDHMTHSKILYYPVSGAVEYTDSFFFSVEG